MEAGLKDWVRVGGGRPIRSEIGGGGGRIGEGIGCGGRFGRFGNPC